MDDDSYCGICRYFVRQSPGAAGGYCMRNPPVPFMVGMQQPTLAGQQPQPLFSSTWPIVGDMKVCGEFRDIERPAPPIDPRTIDLKKLTVEKAEGKA